MDNKFGFGRIKNRFFQTVKPELPKKVAQHILLFFKANYNKEGYNDKSFTPWKKRKYTVNRKLLVKTGALRDGLYVKAETFDKISITNDVEYFEYHNNGTDTLPERPIIYESTELDKEVEMIIEQHIWKLFR
jgi:phage gpG-like protein